MKYIFMFILLFFLAACSSEDLEEIKINGLKNKERIVVTDSKIMNTIKEALQTAEMEPGIVNLANPHFKIVFKNETYFLWITGESGIIMNAKDTHIIFTLSKQAISDLNEIIKES
ncbi:hypothetical protein LCL95_07290 [Bacillus timonensis]|nr:hypothetical protein [Bacillus timonensis]